MFLAAVTVDIVPPATPRVINVQQKLFSAQPILLENKKNGKCTVDNSHQIDINLDKHNNASDFGFLAVT